MSFNLTVIAQAVAFALFIWFTVKFVWPPMLRAIEQRQKTIADGLAAAEQGKKSLETSTRQAEESVKAGRDRAAEIVQVLGQRDVSSSLPISSLAGEGVTVMIGGEDTMLALTADPMRECSIVISRYGARGAGTGALAVVGPMRMRYSRTVSSVRFLSALMSELLSAYYE